MMTETEVVIAVLFSAAVTYFLRALPFLVFRDVKKTPAFFHYLGKVLPYAMIAMLVVYGLKDISFVSLNGWLPQLIGCAVAVGTYLLTKQSVFAIGVSTITYMFLVAFVFV